MSSAAHPAIQLPAMLAQRACDVLSGKIPPVTPRDAATVMLLRPMADGADTPSLQVYMLRRRPTMAFAPGAFVFPGGSVDPRDAEIEVEWAGPDAAEWGRMIDAPAELARALVCAAVRETFEESGVLLAGPAADTVVADTRGDDWEADRQALLDRSVSLAGLLRRYRAETPVFEEMRRRQALERGLPLATVLRGHRGSVTLSMLLTWMLTAAIVVVILMLPALMPKLFGITPVAALRSR